MASRYSKLTLGTQFKTALGELMSTVAADSVAQHYVRCIKPNDLKTAETFERRLVNLQLRHSGVYEAVKIRKAGFPFRYFHRQFHLRWILKKLSTLTL